MKIIVGLGNPEPKYAHTHHNMGFLVLDCLASRLGVKFKTRECDSITARAYVNGEPIILAEPQTYMNLSGVAVKQLLGKYKINSADLIVTFDDIDLPRYTVRFRERGSAGTHNGMRNIIQKIGTEDFPRVRVGIGRPPEHVPLTDYVLAEVPMSDREQMAETIEKAVDEILKLICSP